MNVRRHDEFTLIDVIRFEKYRGFGDAVENMRRVLGDPGDG
jgi:hypothetical protein